MKKLVAFRFCFAILALTVSAAALGADSGFQSWGPRVGFADDPDQFIAGIHLDMGEVASHVRWQPSFEVGFGDDVTSLSGNVLFAYYFGKQSGFTPYAGGQLAVVYFDADRGDGGTEFGFDAVGGVETRVGSRVRMLFELQIGFGDIHDAKILAGWKF